MLGVEAIIRIVELAAARLCGASDTSSSPMNQGLMASPQCALRRAAWLPRADTLSLAALEGLAVGLPDGIQLETANLAQPAVFASGTARVLMNLLLVAADSLPAGGTVALAGSDKDVFVRISGPNAAWPAGFTALIHDEAAAMAVLATEPGLQPGLTVLLAGQQGLRLSLVIPPTRQDTPPVLRLTA
jgi:hypothetical protein